MNLFLIAVSVEASTIPSQVPEVTKVMSLLVMKALEVAKETEFEFASM